MPPVKLPPDIMEAVTLVPTDLLVTAGIDQLAFVVGAGVAIEKVPLDVWLDI